MNQDQVQSTAMNSNPFSLGGRIVVTSSEKNDFLREECSALYPMPT
jgi:citrate lyase synthetase